MNPVHSDHLLRDVEVASLQLRRIYRVIRETMRGMCGWVAAAERLETKRLLARHAWIDAGHADMLRKRVLELRHPRVDVDDDTPAAWRELLSMLPRAHHSAELLAGVYRVIKPRVLAALEVYRAGSDAIDDAPSHLIVRRCIGELRDQIAEAEEEFAELPADERASVDAWVAYLEACLVAVGGLSLDALHDAGARLPHRPGFSDRPPFRVPAVPRRRRDYEPAVMQVPPRQPRDDVESRIWLAIDHANETWAAELPDALVWEYGEDAPWELLRDTTRWAFDETRHAMMGERRLRAWGFRPGIDYPIVSDHFRAFTDAGMGLKELLLVLHALELSGPHWKAGLVKEFRQVGDRNSSVDCDYDWADESGHIRVGLEWTRLLFPGLTKQQVIEKHSHLRAFWANWMKTHHEHGTHGYERFLPRIERLARQIAAREGTGGGKPAKLTYGGTDVFDFDMPRDREAVAAE